MAGILPEDKNALGWGNSAAKAQRDQMSGDAKDLVNGKGASVVGADAMVNGKKLPSKGKSFAC